MILVKLLLTIFTMKPFGYDTNQGARNIPTRAFSNVFFVILSLYWKSLVWHKSLLWHTLKSIYACVWISFPMSYQLDQSKNALEIRVLETLNPTGKLSAHTFLERLSFSQSTRHRTYQDFAQSWTLFAHSQLGWKKETKKICLHLGWLWLESARLERTG